MAKMIQCPKCGKLYVSILKVCPECGMPRPKNTKKTVAIVISCIAVFLVIGAISGLSQNNSTASENEPSETPSSSEVQVGGNISETPEETKEEYIASCEEIDYKSLARNPEQYEGKRLKVKIEVAQIMTPGLLKSGGYRGYEDYDFDIMDDSQTYLEKEWYIEYETDNEPRILKDDIIIFYGEYGCVEELERALTGTKDYIPVLNGKYHEVVSD